MYENFVCWWNCYHTLLQDHKASVLHCNVGDLAEVAPQKLEIGDFSCALLFSAHTPILTVHLPLVLWLLPTLLLLLFSPSSELPQVIKVNYCILTSEIVAEIL